MTENFGAKMLRLVTAGCCIFALSVALAAQVQLDPIQVDPQHFKLEYEDAHVRVLRFRLPPGEKSPMQDHSARSVVNLTDAKARWTNADGTVEEVIFAAGAASHFGPMRYAVENIGNEILETVSTEFKDQSYIAKAPSGRQSTSASTSTSTPLPEKPLAGARAASPASATSVAALPTPEISQTSRGLQASLNPSQSKPSVDREKTTEAISPPLQPETPEGVVKTVSVNGAELAYVERGQGPVVILLHDTLGDYRSWSKTVEALAPHFRVISYSRRYHYPNYSSGKERDYTFQLNGKDLTDFIRNLNVGAVHLVGAGYGASIVAAVAAKNPELVRTLTLVDSELVDMLPPARAEAARYTREEIYHIIRKPLNKGQTDTALQMYVNWGRGSGVWEHMNVEDRSREKQNANALKAQTYDAPSPALSCASARGIKSPVLLITGEIAPPNERDIVAALAACLARVQQLHIPKVEYAGYGFDSRALLQFLLRQP